MGDILPGMLCNEAIQREYAAGHANWHRDGVAVIITLDLLASTLEYCVDGQPLGVAFTDVQLSEGPKDFALTLRHGVTVTLRGYRRLSPYSELRRSSKAQARPDPPNRV